MKTDNETFRLIAKTTAGLEQVLADELQQLGAENIELMTRAVAFDGDLELMYKANYLLRSALRILKPLTTFKATDEQKLYDQIYKIQWHEFLETEQTFAIDAVVSGGRFTHSQFISYKTKDAIADQFRDRFGARPSVNTEDPDLRINIHIYDDQCSVARDSSGDSLHKRGYRYVVDKAPINEVLAAGLILLSGWKADSHFMDCMCGSATIPIEAAMMAMHIPAGYFRDAFGFMKWKDFDKELWLKIKREADDKISDFDFEIIGSDRSAKAIDIARQNLQKAHLHKDIQLLKKPMELVVPPSGGGLMLINPPYGERLEETDIIGLYSSIGDSLKQNFKGWQAWVISSDFTALKHVGLKPSKKYTVYNGPLECRFARYDIFEGKHKDMKRAAGEGLEK
ncbi:MAG: putative N6-adenine-specific DNA methylase [Bacteroidetes bacterium]|nr:MAG: putative N6-adenine-specific DNA methylase [Bacteroidota bacterium]